jgi:hypothetical protein
VIILPSLNDQVSLTGGTTSSKLGPQAIVSLALFWREVGINVRVIAHVNALLSGTSFLLSAWQQVSQCQMKALRGGDTGG